MSLETSKKILKIFGIIGIIFAVLGLLLGIAVIAGGGLITAGLSDPSLSESGISGAAHVAGFAIIAGIILTVGAVIALLEGIFSVRAAKDPSKIMPAFVFAILGVLSGVGSLVSTITSGAGGSQIASGVISLAISCLVLVAANTIRTSRNKL